MATLIDLSIDVTKLPKSKFIQGKNGAVYCNLTIAISDDTNQWGKNVSAYEPQSKEEREAKQNRNWIGNGKVFWTDNKICLAEKQDAPAPAAEAGSGDADLPF